MGYWDLEEGKDCIEKTWITTKLGTALGLVGSAYHIVAFQPDSAMQAIQRATAGTVTMGEWALIHFLLLLYPRWVAHNLFFANLRAPCVQKNMPALSYTASLGAIFGMTTCLSAQLREAPDDPLNYFIGGCASGVFLGARTHSAMTGTTACLGLGTVAMLTKVGKKEGWRFSGAPKL